MPGRKSKVSQVPLSQPSIPASQQICIEEEMETQDDVPASQAVSQARKSLANISPDIVKKKVNDLVQYLLVMEMKKYPIKRLEINKMVLKEHSKAFTVFMEKAKKVLNDTFGLELVEVDSKQKSYILINSLEQDPNMQLALNKEEKAKMGLVMTILSVIFMKGNVVQDDELFNFLKKVGVDVYSHHEVFGDVKKFVTVELVRQGYLDFQRQANVEPVAYEIRWGQRAKHELSKKNTLQFVCQIYNQEDPKIWTDQFKDAEELTE